MPVNQLLDMRTVLFSFVLTNTICLLVIFLLYRDQRRRTPEIKFWLIDYVFNFVMMILMNLRGLIPDFLSIIVANVLVVAGTMLLVYGLEIYVHKRGPQIQNVIILIVFTLVHAYFTYVQVSLTARNINITAATLLIMAQAAWLMLRRVGPEFRNQARLVGLVSLAYCVVFSVRIFFEATIPQSNDMFRANTFTTLAMIAYQMLFIALTYALFLMVNRQLVAELEGELVERKKANEALIESENKFALIFQNSPDALAITSIENGGIIEVNESFYRISEFTHDELVGKNTVELNLWVSPTDRDEYIDLLRQKGRIFNYETNFCKKSGKLFTAWISSGIIQLKDSICVLNVIHDVSDRVMAEQALRESEERFRSYVENASDIVYSLSMDGIFGYVSPNWAEVLGNPVSEVIGKSYNDFVHPDDIPATDAYLEGVVAGNENSGGVEYRVRHMDGSWRLHFSKVSVVRDAQGKAISVIGIARDMTGYRQTEAALKANQNLLDKIFDILPIGLWLADKTGQLFRSNLAGRKIWGGEKLVERSEYGVFKARRLPSREELATDDWALVHTIAEKKTILDEALEIDTFDGQKRAILNYSTPVLDANGDLEAAIVVNLDITERQRIEDTLRFLAERHWEANGNNFFQSLAKYLAECLGMDYVCIDRLEPDGLVAVTEAIYFDGKFEDNVSYALKDTPCGDVVGKTICVFPKQVRNLFPQDDVLQQMVAESYIGTTLWSSGGQPIGLIAMIARQPLENLQAAETILQLVTVRAAGELERREADAKLNQQVAELRRWNEATLGREMRVLELKSEVNELLRSAGQPPRYASEGGPPRYASEGGPPRYASEGHPPQNARAGGPPRSASPGA
ncbi:MAG: PAS domain S-box protein, partial [Anaerolineaceae bacterium]|nr:PAS domain S-box protein [Anaerolineaceae bacterium]